MNNHYIYLSFLFPLLVLATDALVQLAQQAFSLDTDYRALNEQLIATQSKLSEIELAVEIREESK